MTKNKVEIKEKSQSNSTGNTNKKTCFKAKAWAVKFVKKHKVLMDLLKDK